MEFVQLKSIENELWGQKFGTNSLTLKSIRLSELKMDLKGLDSKKHSPMLIGQGHKSSRSFSDGYVSDLRNWSTERPLWKKPQGLNTVKTNINNPTIFQQIKQ